MMIYAIPDLHGRFDLLIRALEVIYQKAQSPGKIIFLGDYVDRGPDSKKILDHLMAGSSDGWEWVILRGNHEEIMAQCLSDIHPLDWWLRHGGVNTLRSFGMQLGSTIDRDSVSHIYPYVEWISSLAVIYVDEHRIFVHAGVDDNLSLEEQTGDVFMWHRYMNGEGWSGHFGKHVVHGHDSSRHGAKRFAGRTCLDAKAYETGRLMVGVFDDETPGGPLEILEITVPFVEKDKETPTNPLFIVGDLRPYEER